MFLVRVFSLPGLSFRTHCARIADFMHEINVDRFDLDILTELQNDATQTNAALAERIHLSPSQVSRRRQRLEENGVLQRVVALVDPVLAGIGAMAFAHVTLERHGGRRTAEFESAVAALPQVLECFSVTGEADYVLRIVAPDLAVLSDFLLKQLLALPGVTHVRSNIALERVKQTTALPLDHLRQAPQARPRLRFAG